MQEVPAVWVWASCIYFVVSIIWSVVLVVGMVKLYQKVMPVLTEGREASGGRSIRPRTRSTFGSRS